jgi:hypothetical protein
MLGSVLALGRGALCLALEDPDAVALATAKIDAWHGQKAVLNGIRERDQRVLLRIRSV